MHTHFEITNLVGILGILITLIAGAMHCGIIRKPLNVLLPAGAVLYLVGRTSALFNFTSINDNARGVLLTVGIGMVAFGFHQLRKQLAETGSNSTATDSPGGIKEETHTFGTSRELPEQNPVL